MPPSTSSDWMTQQPDAEHPKTAPDALQISSWSGLAAHLAAPGKRDAYRKLLREFGIDPDAGEVRNLGERPVILFAEQPGCWLTPRDVVRARLLERLIQRGDFDRELSGVRTLEHDRFTANGDKGIFLDFHLHRDLGPARLVGSQFVKKFEHRTYASLKIAAMSYQRVRAIWDYSLQMIESASASPARFVQVTAELLAGSPVKGARDVLPESNDPERLLALGEDLARLRLEPAFKALWPARAALVKDVAWHHYWNGVNSELLGLPIESLSPLLGRFLLAVRDPVKLARRLHEESGAAPGEPVSVAGLVTDDDVFRMVLFDPDRESFFALRRDGTRRTFPWEELRACAGDELGARPSGILEYLLLAAFGFYLLVDCADGVQPFHRAVCEIHERCTGLGYPWITFEVHGALAPEENRFLDLFHPGFPELAVDVLSGFLDR
jgi:hypothetical protein